MFKRWLKILLIVWLLLLVLLVTFLLFERWRGQISLAHYKHELAAKGETLDVRQLLTPVVDADNGAYDFLRLQPLIKEGKVISLHSPPKMKLIAPGKAMVGFRESFWVDGKTTYSWNEVVSDLATNRLVLDQIRVALAKPAFDFKPDHSQGFAMNLFSHLAPTKSLCQWFGPAVQNSMRHEEKQAALEDLLAAIAIPKVLENDHILISELVRIAISSMNMGTTWEALQADGWTDEQLGMIQKAWEKNTFGTNMIRSLEVERDDGDVEFERFRKSNDETYRAIIWGEFFNTNGDSDSSHWWHGDFVRKQLYCRIWRFAWSYQDEKFYLEGMDQLIHDNRTGAEKVALQQESVWLDLPIAKAPHQSTYNSLRFGISAQSLGTISRAIVKSARAETERSMVICAVALKRYQLRYGKSAPDLNALVPEFLPSVPLDYMDGKPMKYHLKLDGTWLLYSVGDDGRDDSGDPSLRDPTYHWIWRGKDAVWPSSASSKEIDTWRKEVEKN